MSSVWAIRLGSSTREEIELTSQGSFFDSRTLMAIVLVGAVFIGWQSYMQHKYPEAFKPKETETSQTNSEDTTSADVAAKESISAQTEMKAITEVPVGHQELRHNSPERIVPFISDNLSFDISSHGMGIRNIVIRKYKDRNGQSVVLGLEAGKGQSFETRVIGSGEALDFEISKLSNNHFVGRSKQGAVSITKTMEIDPEKYEVKWKISTSGQDKQFIGIENILADRIESTTGPSLFAPSLEIQEFFVNTGDHKDRVHFTDEDIDRSWDKVRVLAIGSQYFAQALLDNSPIMPEVKGHLDTKSAVARLVLRYPKLNSAGDEMELAYTAFMGPKYVDLLNSIDPEMASIVDFGFFDYIGRYILTLLRWFHSWLGNWGWAVIGLTVLVRLILLPINMYSYKSMRAMQAIQPQIKEMRERYKDDQQKQQQEMMKLMKENKVNPVGGCLPMFLQMPIFFALYQVLGHSIELYQAPFALWVKDLSMKDPLYVLPVLMGITMFVQQKITPNTMDPAQAKVLLMMPLLFTFFMLSLPSGLTLYMLVGAVFSVAQQFYFMRGQQPAT